MEKRVKIVLKSGKDISVRRLHPWIFSGAIKKVYGNPIEGEIVNVYDNKDEFLGQGHYNDGSIAIRLTDFEEVEINAKYWERKIEKAWNYRLKNGFSFEGETNVFRLIHGEGDNLPGLIIDYYNGVAVIQAHSIGMFKAQNEIVEALKKVLGSNLKSIYSKSKSTLPGNMQNISEDGLLFGSAGKNHFVLENGLKFFVDWEKGQKTGFFVDQRENRKLVGEMSRNRKVLNVFGYTGGFSVYAIKGEAELVHTVDSSAGAIELTDKNVEMNFSGDSRHKSFCVDAFEFLENMEEDYDIVILDPPAFAKHQNVLHNALQGYKRLNLKALQKMKSGSFLFTFSCSQVVTKENFRKSVFAAATQCGKTVRIMYQLSQPIDHPVNIFHPESEYLKGLVLYIE
ncbi:MAG: class I SAM-dependent rRNA methyltransferase [Bacteroidales bacterium]|nr:class I SAM-dependent rRNA methyltransferase [Bacteroidales bacterium]